VESDFTEKVSSEIGKYNDNATSKTNAFNSNASSKLTQFNNNADGVLSQAESYATEAKNARDEAVEIVDPEGWRTDTRANIASLAVAKSNRGEFWFECGALTTTNKMPLNAPFSCIWTMAMTQEEFKKHKTYFPKIIGNLGYWSDAGYGWCINRIDSTSLIGIGANNGSGSGKYNTLDIINYLDGNPHIWLVVYNGTNISLYIDNVKRTSVAFTFESSEATNPLGIGSTPTSANQNYGVWGKIYRIKYFNFDMSDANAPYTIADYISGKDESPLLNLGVKSYNASDMTFSSANSTNYPCGVVSDSTADTITITTTGETKSEYTWIDGKSAISIPQGANVEVSLADLDVATSVQCYFYSGSTKVQDLSGVSNNNPTNSFVAPANLTKLSLIVHTGVKPIPSGTTMVITGLKIKVNGALLSLDDYSISVGGSKIVPDVSGNLNDATITGAVYGSKDNSIARLSALIGQANA
jgi:hypothetical protein